MTMTMPPAQIAARLRILADLLDLTTDPTPLRAHLILSVQQYMSGLDESRRVAAITAAAEALGMTARPEEGPGRGWQHRAENGDPFAVTLYTDITGPQVCACGAACTHSGGVVAAAA